MLTQPIPLQAARTSKLNDGKTLFATLVELLDVRLRAWHGIQEYSTSPDCNLRIQFLQNGRPMTLADGQRLRAGDPIIDLHLWNDHILLLPEHGATIGWARRTSRAIDLSLHELAREMALRSDLHDIVAVRASMGFGSRDRSDQLERIASRFGFERVGSDTPKSWAERLFLFGENILISMLVLARNPGSLRWDTLRRARTVVFVSRHALLTRYGFATTSPNAHGVAAAGSSDA